ncbi:hypothetical protein L8Q74_01565 [Enterobacter roggenkampii]|nr:hypothetical protein [Enterobacter roggenkampii]
MTQLIHDKMFIVAYDSKDTDSFTPPADSKDFPLIHIEDPYTMLQELFLNTFLDEINEDDEPQYRTYRESLEEKDYETELHEWILGMCLECFVFKNDSAMSEDEKLNALQYLCYFQPSIIWNHGKIIDIN